MAAYKNIASMYSYEFQLEISIAYINGNVTAECIKANRVLDKKLLELETKLKNLAA